MNTMHFSRGSFEVDWKDNTKKKAQPCALMTKCNGQDTTGVARLNFTLPSKDPVTTQACCIRCATETVIKAAREKWPLISHSAHTTQTNSATAISRHALAAVASESLCAALAATAPAQSALEPSAKRSSPTSRPSRSVKSVKAEVGSRSPKRSTTA